MGAYYKAVRLDKTSHYDKATKWRVGAVVRPSKDPHDCHGACGVGIHCSPTLLGAVSYQRGPSRYYEVEPGQVLGADDTKVRCNQVRVIRELRRAEIDKLAGFKLWEANHPVNPLLNKRRLLTEDEMTQLIKQWASVWSSTGASVRDSVGDSVRISVWASVGDSVWTYTATYFDIKYKVNINPSNDLWNKGLVPSFDGKLWRLHGKEGKVIWKGKIEDIK